MGKPEGAPAFTMSQLATFVAVAEAGSFSAASARLHLSASALSASVTGLEPCLEAELLGDRVPTEKFEEAVAAAAAVR